MANPLNTSTLVGMVESKPKFIRKQTGDFQIQFVLSVKREFQTEDGRYEYDHLLVHYTGNKNRINAAKLLKEGDAISVIGSVRSNRYNGQYITFIECDDFSWIPKKQELFEKKVLPVSVNYAKKASYK